MPHSQVVLSACGFGVTVLFWVVVVGYVFLVVACGASVVLQGILASFERLVAGRLQRRVLRLRVRSLTEFVNVERSVRVRILRKTGVLFLRRNN